MGARELLAGIGTLAAWAVLGLHAGKPDQASWVMGSYLVAGAFFIVATWPVLLPGRERPGPRSRTWWILVGSVALLSRTFVWLLPPEDDVSRYVVEGKVLLAGKDPYVLAPSDPRLDAIRDEHFARVNHPDLPAIYPPLAIGAGALLDLVTEDERAWKVLGLVLDLAAVALVAATIRRRKDDPRLVLLAAWNPVLVYTFAGRGHNDVLLVFFLALAVWAYERRRGEQAGFALGLAALSKLSAGVLAPVLLLPRGKRAVLAFSLVLVLGLAPLGLALAQGDALLSLRTFLGSMRSNDSFHYAIYELLTGPRTNEAASRLASLVTLALLAAAIATLTFLRRDRSEVEALPRSATVLLVLLLLAPTVHLWYLAWAVPLLPFARAARPALAVWSATIGLYLFVQVVQERTGVWQEPGWIRLPEYAPVLLAWGAGVAARAVAPSPRAG